MIERWNFGGGGHGAPPHATALHGEGVHQLPEEMPAGSVPVDEAVDAMPAPKPVEAEVASAPSVAKKASHWGKRVAWLLAMVAMGVILGGVIIFVLKFIDGPSVTTQSTTLEKLKATPVSTPTLSLWGGKYVEFKYPSLFDVMGAAPGNRTALEAYNFSSKSSYSRQLAVSVTPLASGKLDDDSSYRFRSITPDQYAISDIKLNGEPAAKTVKTGDGEITVFWAHKGMLFTLSATTDNPVKDKLETYIAQIEPTIRWRQ